MTKISVLVVDDDASFRTYVTLMLRARGYVTEGVESGDDLFRRLSSGANPPSVILLDVNLPDADGIEVIGKLRGLGVRVPVIMLSGIGHVRTVVEAMKLGALDFLMKPFTDTALENAIRTAFEDGVRVCELSQPLTVVDGEARSFVTLNPRMRRLADIVQRVARTDVPVLITGESGVGKEVIARHAHRHSGRHDKPFIKVNCAAMPRDLLESELFGYERGAFTGAVSDKPGKVELAHTGTLLLDEIGEMSPLLQAKLLHVLQDGVFSRLGSTKTMRVDTRIIAATNINIEDAVAQGKFREDLYYRLNVIRIDLPPLRERREDIPALCNQFIEMYRERYKSTVREIPLELMNRFAEYGWPGNVRELENAIKRFLVLPQHDIILDSSPTNAAAPGAPPAYLPLPPGSSLLAVASAAADRAQLELVRQVLRETHGNRKAAARRMNICYKALLNKLKRWETANAIPSRQFDKTGEVAVS